MDITQELSRLNKGNISDVLKTLHKEQSISEKKTYLFEVINFTQKMTEFAPIFLKVGCNSIELINVSDLTRSYTIELSPSVRDVRDRRGVFYPWFNDLLSIHPTFDIRQSFTNDFGKFSVDLTGDIQTQMYASLLSDELLATLKYNKLNMSLESKENSSRLKKI